MRAYRKVDESYEFKIEPSKLVLLGVGSGLTLLLVFLVGVLVGKSLWAERGRGVIPQGLGADPSPVPSEATGQRLTSFSIYDLGKPDGQSPTMEPAAPAVQEVTGETTVGATVPGPESPAPAALSPPRAEPPEGAKTAAVKVPPAAAAPQSPAAGKPASPQAAKTPGPEGKAAAGNLPTPRFTVQVGSYRDRAAADEQVKKIRGRNVPAQVVAVPVEGRTWYRVQVSSFETRAEAEAYYRKKLLPQNVQGFVTNR